MSFSNKGEESLLQLGNAGRPRAGTSFSTDLPEAGVRVGLKMCISRGWGGSEEKNFSLATFSLGP